MAGSTITSTRRVTVECRPLRRLGGSLALPGNDSTRKQENSPADWSGYFFVVVGGVLAAVDIGAASPMISNGSVAWPILPEV